MESTNSEFVPRLLQSQLSSDVSTSTYSVHSILSRSESKTLRRAKSGSNHSVSFAEGTIFHEDDTIALTITSHQYRMQLGYTEYVIQLLYRGEGWTIKKRYRDFEELDRQLIEENLKFKVDKPILPKKRWFEKQRWMNRFDYTYGIKRKTALQEYLRALVKIPQFRYESLVLTTFLNVPHVPPLRLRESRKAITYTEDIHLNDMSIHNRSSTDGLGHKISTPYVRKSKLPGIEEEQKFSDDQEASTNADALIEEFPLSVLVFAR